MIDWENIKFRASSFGNLMAEPVSKADKEAGKLGLSCQKELLNIYRKVVYNWDEDDVTTPAMEKGIKVQKDSISMYSIVEGQVFIENNVHLENDWFCGTPDCFLGEDIRNATQVDDMKNAFLLSNFTERMVETVTPSQKCQLNVYYSLTGSSGGNIVHTLMSLPEDMFERECNKLLWKMTNSGEIATDLDPKYKAEVEKLKKKYWYGDIPYNERVFKQPVPRDEELIQKMKDKVPVFRDWLRNFSKKHMSLYPK